MPVTTEAGRFQPQTKPMMDESATSTPALPPLMSPDRGPHLPAIGRESAGGPRSTRSPGPESDRSLRSHDSLASHGGDNASYSLASSATLMNWTDHPLADKKLRHASLQGDIDRVRLERKEEIARFRGALSPAWRRDNVLSAARATAHGEMLRRGMGCQSCH